MGCSCGWTRAWRRCGATASAPSSCPLRWLPSEAALQVRARPAFSVKHVLTSLASRDASELDDLLRCKLLVMYLIYRSKPGSSTVHQVLAICWARLVIA